jgi:superfamily II RNA helicase
MKYATNKKDIQRQLDSVKNKQIGPKWNTAWANYNTLIGYKKEYTCIVNNLEELKAHDKSIEPYITFLFDAGYISNSNRYTLTNKDLTLKGILATEVNEGHPILMTELYTREILHTLSGEETVVMLSCFLESDVDSSNKITELAKEFQNMEDKYVSPIRDYWNVSTAMMEPMRKWLEGDDASVICVEYDIFEGNFMRSVMKMANIVDEWISMATYCQHIEQIDKMIPIRQKIVREYTDSLYLHI